MFNSFISDSFNLHAPVKSVKVTKPLASWLHDSIRNLMKKEMLIYTNSNSQKMLRIGLSIED